MIELIDDNVGRMLAALEQTGQADNTLVIFTSDHGEMLGDHGLLLKGCRFYEGLVHVPLILRWPGRIRAGATTDALVELTDLAPTLLDAAGLEVPRHMAGRSLLPLLRGTTTEHRDAVRCEYYEALSMAARDRAGWSNTRATMIRDRRYKLAVYHGHPTGELFDLETDPARARQPVGPAPPRGDPLRPAAPLLRRHRLRHRHRPGGHPRALRWNWRPATWRPRRGRCRRCRRADPRPGCRRRRWPRLREAPIAALIQIPGIDVAQAEQQFRAVVEAVAYTVEHRGHVLAHGRPIGATATPALFRRGFGNRPRSGSDTHLPSPGRRAIPGAIPGSSRSAPSTHAGSPSRSPPGAASPEW